MGIFSKTEPEQQIDSLKKEVKQQQEVINELNEVNATLQDKIEELEMQIENGNKSLPTEKKPVLPGKTFKVNGEEHVFIVPQFTNPLDGNLKISAEEALTDPELLKYIVEHDCGLTKKLS